MTQLSSTALGITLCITFGVTLLAPSAASAEKKFPKAQVRAFFPKSKGPQLPPYLGKVKFGMPDTETKKVMPSELGEFMRCNPAEFPDLEVSVDHSYGGLHTVRVDVKGVDMPKVLKKQWGKPVVKKGLMDTTYHWTNPKKGTRAKLSPALGQKDAWQVELSEYKDDSILFNKGKVSMPVAFEGVTIGMPEPEVKKKVTALGDSYWIEPKGHGELRVWIFTWSDYESDRLKEVSVTFGATNPTKMLKKLWGKPKKDGKKRPYWLDAKAPATDREGKPTPGLRATLLKENDEYKLNYTANARGDYTEY